MDLIKQPKNLEELFPLVEKEIKLIKEHFTKKEIELLLKSEKYDINGESSKECIYGTMTGDCNSPRISDFIKSRLNTVILTSNKNYKVDDETKILNIDAGQRSYYFMTPLEAYIYPEKNNAIDQDDYVDKPEKREKDDFAFRNMLINIEKVLTLFRDKTFI